MPKIIAAIVSGVLFSVSAAAAEPAEKQEKRVQQPQVPPRSKQNRLRKTAVMQERAPSVMDLQALI